MNKLTFGMIACSLLMNSCIFKHWDDDDKDPKPVESEVSKLLTGGLKDNNGKTWLLSDAPYSSGMGPYFEDRLDASYWNWVEGLTGDEWQQGAVQNEYTFVAKNSQYIPKNQNVTVHFDFANKYFGTSQEMYQNIALHDPKHKQAPYILKNEGIGITGYTLEITNGSYIGFFDGRHKYEIAKINADTMILRHKFSDFADADPINDETVWYFTYIAKK